MKGLTIKLILLKLFGFCLVIAIFTSPILISAQTTAHNYKYLTAVKKHITTELEKRTPDSLKAHPEYGILPYNAQCKNCTELLDKRDANSRYFVSDSNSKEFFVQQSYFPLHFKDKDGRWITADHHLRATAQNGLYMADRQPVQTFYNDASKLTGLVIDGIQFSYNQHLELYYLDSNNQKQALGNINRDATTIGDNGVYTTNAWPDINMEQAFMPGGIETNFMINKKPDLSSANGWLVFEDHFTLPAGCRLVEDENDGHKLDNDNWQGSYKLVNSNGRTIASIERPRYFDSNRYGTHGIFKLRTEGDVCTLSVMVPASWLNSPGLTYPVYIDPYVKGFDSLGFYIPVSNPTAEGSFMGFSNSRLGCPYQLMVTVPGKCTLQDGYLEVEYHLTDSICIPQPSPNTPYCRYQDILQTLIGPCDTLGMACDQILYGSGICTSDSLLVSSARPLHVGAGGISGTGNFVICDNPLVQPICDSFHIPFTLYNFSVCTDTCSYNCAYGTYFAITLRGLLLEDGVVAVYDTLHIDPTKLISNPLGGVPPFTYKWFKNGNLFDTDSLMVDSSKTNAWYVNYVYDQCNDSAVSYYYLNYSATDTVWPGDANADGIANNLDLLNIGVAYSDSGTARHDSSNNWIGQPATNWLIPFANGIDCNNADCDGNGIVNANDTIPVLLNYGMTHLKTNISQRSPGSPQLYAVVSPSTLTPGDTGVLNIYLGTPSLPATNIYGLAFSVSYPSADFKNGSINAFYGNSWLGSIGTDLIALTKNLTANGQMDMALTRIDHQGRSNNGIIAQIKFVDLANADTLHPLFNLLNVTSVDSAGNIVPLDVVDISTGIVDLAEPAPKITLFPNPASNKISITASKAIDSYIIYNPQGQEIAFREGLKTQQATIDLQGWTKGIYFIQATIGQQKITKRFAILE